MRDLSSFGLVAAIFFLVFFTLYFVVLVVAAKTTNIPVWVAYMRDRENNPGRVSFDAAGLSILYLIWYVLS